LNEQQVKYLQQMHDQYGSGPINLRKELKKEEGGLSERDNKLLMLIEAICGCEELDDRALVVLYDFGTAFAIGLMQNQ